MSNEKKLHFETLQLHVGQESADPATDARAVPIYQTTSYVFRNSQHAADRFGLRDAGNIYGRLTNSTQGVFEDRVAALEGGVAGLAVASGAAAITYALQNIARNGDHIIAANNIYGGTYNLVEHTLSTQGVETTIVDPADFDAVEKAFRDNTKAIIIETFGNPNASVTDVDRISEIAHRHNTIVIVDNTFGTPFLFRPIEHGADVVVHSATKFIGGHGSSLGGVIVDAGKFDWKANADKYPSSQARPIISRSRLRRRGGRCGIRHPHPRRHPPRHRCSHLALQRLDPSPRPRDSLAARRASRVQHEEGGRVPRLSSQGGKGQPSLAAFTPRPRALHQALP